LFKRICPQIELFVPRDDSRLKDNLDSSRFNLDPLVELMQGF